MRFSTLSVIAAGVGAASAFSTAPTFRASQQRSVGTDTELYERKPFITGNWKLNPGTKQEAEALASDVAAAVTADSPCDVAIFAPFPFIETANSAANGKLSVGAQMVTPEEKGAFTGAISASMLKSIGVEWALAGHSERRTINREGDVYINSQCKMLIDQGMKVILCIGETDAEFESDLVGAICELQLKKGLNGIDAADMDRVVIAYEPVWAIGTGKVATPEIAQSVHATIRGILVEMYGEQIAEDTRILYGGSVTPESVDGLLAKPDIDGALVGGASLDAEKFARIINFESVEAPAPQVA